MTYDIKVYTELRDRLAELYPTRAEGRRVAAEAGADIKGITFEEGSALLMWSNILAALRAHKRLDGLVAVLEREAPKLAQLARNYAAEVASSAGTADEAPTPSAPPRLETRENRNLSNNDLRFLLAMEDGENRLPEHFQKIADEYFGYKYEHDRPEPLASERLGRLSRLALVEAVGGSEYRITSQGQHVLHGIRKNPGSYRSVLERNRESRGDARERGILAYESATTIDESCLNTLLTRATPAKIRYAGEVQDRITKLDEIVRNPAAFLATIASIANMASPEQREKAASEQLAYITEVQRKLHSQMSQNEAALQTLLSHIDALCASPEQAGKALTTFAAFAALQVIHKLKKGFDWIGDAPRFWLEHYSFGSDPSPPYFDLVPDQSVIGRAVFGCRYWAMARVGQPPKYELVIFPLKKVLPNFLSGTRGDQESYWTWISPQLAFYTRDYPITEFPVGDWEAYTLTGRGGVEWWGRGQPPPWDVVTRINMADPSC
jgi:hypothetical protein